MSNQNTKEEKTIELLDDEQFTLKEKLVNYMQSSEKNSSNAKAETEILKELGPVFLSFSVRGREKDNEPLIYCINFSNTLDCAYVTDVLKQYFGDSFEMLGLPEKIAKYQEKMKEHPMTDIVPEVATIQRLGNYNEIATQDPYLPLMLINPQSRPFLSKCVDQLVEDGDVWFNGDDDALTPENIPKRPFIPLKLIGDKAREYDLANKVEQYAKSAQVIENNLRNPSKA